MIKKLVLILCLLVLLIPFGASAQGEKHFDALEPFGDFYVFGEESEKVEALLGLTEDEISDYCSQNSIEFLAVDAQNLKQIKLSVTQTDFSNSIVTFNNLSDDSILELLPQISGFENVKGAIVYKDGQKFVKTELKSVDSGGEYILTEYITVADRNLFILSFNNSPSENTEYIEKTFETFKSFLFANIKAESKASGLIPFAIAVFALVALAMAVTVVKDIIKSKNQGSNGEE